MPKRLRRAGGLRCRVPWAFAACMLVAILSSAPLALAAAQHDKTPRFKYVGGTEHVQQDCVGTLQIGSDSLTFRCDPYSVTVPFRDIETMQYRDDVTRHVRKMKVKWTLLPPPHIYGSKNRYFTLLYRGPDGAHVLILEIPPDQMRPYLAELDLKVGKRVEVQSHEDYRP